MGGRKFTRINISHLTDDPDDTSDSGHKNDKNGDYIPLNDVNDYSGDEIDLNEDYEQIDDEEDGLDSGHVESDEKEDDEGLDFGKKIRDYYQDQSSSDEEFEEKVREAKKLNDDLYRNVTDESADMLNISAEVADVSKVLKDVFKNDEITLDQDIKSTITLSSEDRVKLIEKSHPEFIALINDLHNNVNLAYENILPLLNSAKFNKFCTKNGMEYLDLRNELILIYMTYFSYYMLMKVNGRPVKGHPVIERLLEIRLILDKTRPIESRLGYEISKLLELANNAELAEAVNDRAKPELLVTDEESGADSDSDSENEYIDKDAVPRYMTDEHTNIIAKLDKKLTKEEARLKYHNVDASDDSACDMDNEMREFMKNEKLEQDRMMRVFSNKEKKGGKKSRDGLQDLSSLADTVTSSKAWEKFKTNKQVKETHCSSINAGLNTLNQIAKQSKIDAKKNFSADLMVKVKTQKQRPTTIQQFNSKHKQHTENNDSLEALYKETKKIKIKKTVPMITDETVDGARGVSHDILKNKGLTRKRKKGLGNSRVSNRNKYEKSLKKIGKKSSVQMGEYAGETTGINAKVKKSVSIS